MAIPTAGIIVIVIVACLAVTSLGAAMWKQVYPTDHSAHRYNYSRDQELYMRSVRLKNVGVFDKSRARRNPRRGISNRLFIPKMGRRGFEPL